MLPLIPVLPLLFTQPGAVMRRGNSLREPLSVDEYAQMHRKYQARYCRPGMEVVRTMYNIHKKYSNSTQHDRKTRILWSPLLPVFLYIHCVCIPVLSKKRKQEIVACNLQSRDSRYFGILGRTQRMSNMNNMRICSPATRSRYSLDHCLRLTRPALYIFWQE